MDHKKTSTWSKILLSIGFILTSAVYAAWQKQPSVTQTIYTTSVSVPTTPVQQPTMTSMMQGRMGMYVDGSYTGNAFDAYYGMVQVKAVVKNGKIADVVFLQHPQSHENSVFINDQAMPLLTQEAITAQSAQVDGVSGATFTSQAFKESLASALTRAKN